MSSRIRLHRPKVPSSLPSELIRSEKATPGWRCTPCAAKDPLQWGMPTYDECRQNRTPLSLEALLHSLRSCRRPPLSVEVVHIHLNADDYPNDDPDDARTHVSDQLNGRW